MTDRWLKRSENCRRSASLLTLLERMAAKLVKDFMERVDKLVFDTINQSKFCLHGLLATEASKTRKVFSILLT